MKDYKNDSSSVLARFGKDRRAATTDSGGERPRRKPQAERVYTSDRRSEEPRRRSYNPNFTSENRPSRDFSGNGRYSDERKSFGSRGRSFDSETPAYDGPKPAYGRKGDAEFGRKRAPKPAYASKSEGRQGEGYSKKRYSDSKYPAKGASSERSERFERPSRPYKPKTYPKYDAEKQTGEMRLNRFIAQSGLCSRREADNYITAGLVSVNGRIVTELGTKVLPTDEVRFNDEAVHGEKKVYLVLNKPKGYVTTLDDPHASKIVTDLVKNACTERIYPVGRLDKNSLGLLLFTNDGDLAKQLTHPSYRKKKIYQVSLDKPLTRADMEKIADGITLDDGDIYADEISYIKDDKTEVGIEIHSGRNRIVRRIFEHLGYTVQKLDRVYYAGLTKKNLKRGAWRFLTREEVTRLKSGLYD